MGIYSLIDKLRKEKGLKWGYLESVIGAYRGKFVDLRKGKTTLTSDEISKLSKALDVSVDYLLGKTDIKKCPPQLAMS